MTKSFLCKLTGLFLAMAATTSAFFATSQQKIHSSRPGVAYTVATPAPTTSFYSKQSETTRRDMFIDTISSASTYISTVSADVDNISTDQFGLVFTGGIVVMFGGVLSALIVGFILESRNSYANVVADSYAESAGDESFWESLSSEDAEKAKEMLRKFKESKEKASSAGKNGERKAAEVAQKAKALVSDMKSNSKVEENSMFSDYED